ncbi:MAG: TIGR01440 family protein [Candidatus Caccovivens sp.]
MKIEKQCEKMIEEFVPLAKLKSGDILIVGCSTSEVLGDKIGTNSSLETAKEIFDGLYLTLKKYGVFLAIQCCEHLNRAVLIEKEAVLNATIVNAVPQQHAGGSLATVAYQNMKEPVMLEKIQADAGIDIGDTLIGMHLKEVAVPVRLSFNKIGKAHLVCARTRPKFVGGARAVYDEHLL